MRSDVKERFGAQLGRDLSNAKVEYLGDGAYVAVIPGGETIVFADDGLQVSDRVYLDARAVATLARLAGP